METSNQIKKKTMSSTQSTKSEIQRKISLVVVWFEQNVWYKSRKQTQKFLKKKNHTSAKSIHSFRSAEDLKVFFIRLFLRWIFGYIFYVQKENFIYKI